MHSARKGDGEMIDHEKEFGKPERAVGAWQAQIVRILRFLGKER